MKRLKPPHPVCYGFARLWILIIDYAVNRQSSLVLEAHAVLKLMSGLGMVEIQGEILVLIGD
ncbi:hypothetical protein D3C81_2190730 [compost metagenome]